MAKKKAANGSAKSLVIVESPAKARTISKFLGRASRSRPASAISAICPRAPRKFPTQYQEGGLGLPGRQRRQGLRPGLHHSARQGSPGPQAQGPVEGGQGPLSGDGRRPRGRGHQLASLRGAAAEGARSIGWCFTKSPRRRSADASNSPRQIDDDLVRAQEVRRIVDRLYGYDVSPLLWRKMRPRLSAGRVQSVAVRLIVERERQRMAFRAATYWDLLATFATGRAVSRSRPSWCRSMADEIPAGRDFDPATGRAERTPALLLLDEQPGGRVGRAACSEAQFRVAELEDKPYTTRPYPPFTTSTLQQEANRKSASPPGGRCRWPKACTKTATSPTCAPTRRSWPRVAVEAARRTGRVAIWPGISARRRRASIRPR